MKATQTDVQGLRFSIPDYPWYFSYSYTLNCCVDFYNTCVWLLTIPSQAILRASLDTLYCDHSKSLGIITVWPQLIVCHYYALCPRPERLVLVLFTDSTSYWIHTVLSVIVHLYVLVSWKAIYLHAYSSCEHTFVSGQGSYSRVAQNEARGSSRRHYEAKMVHLLPSSAEQLKMPIHWRIWLCVVWACSEHEGLETDKIKPKCLYNTSLMHLIGFAFTASAPIHQHHMAH